MWIKAVNFLASYASMGRLVFRGGFELFCDFCFIFVVRKCYVPEIHKSKAAWVLILVGVINGGD